MPESPRRNGLENRPGIGIDATGGSTVDPTKNVLDLVEAAVKRQDDLRSSFNEYFNTKVLHIQEIVNLRAIHQKEIRELDTARLEKVREVDQLSYRTETERAQTAIRALAEAGAAATETLRKTMEERASLLATQQDVKFAESNKRISALELGQSEGKGKQAVSDPALEALAIEVRRLASSRDEIAGKATVADPMVAIMREELKALRTEMSTKTGFDAGKAAAIAAVGLAGGGGAAALIMQLMKH